MVRYPTALGVLCALILLSAACGATAPSPAPAKLYPLPDPASPSAQPALLSVTLDPIRAGDILVRGSGPAGLPIRIVDVSQVGAALGEGVIGQDSTFAIRLAAPALAGSRIGVLLSDLVGTSFKPSDFAVRDIPLVGPVVASQIVAS